MKVKFPTIVFIMITCFLLTSCLEIVEEIVIKSNGSGTVTYTLNASQSKIKISSLMSLDSINGEKIPHKEEVENKLKTVSKFIASSNGINSCTYNSDYSEYIFKLKIGFDNISSLNQALLGLPDINKIDQSIKDDLYKNSEHKFIKNYDLVDLSKETQSIEKHKKELQEANYTCIVRMEKQIKSASNQRVLISGNKKAAMSKNTIYEALKTPTNLTFTINY